MMGPGADSPRRPNGGRGQPPGGPRGPMFPGMPMGMRGMMTAPPRGPMPGMPMPGMPMMGMVPSPMAMGGMVMPGSLQAHAAAAAATAKAATSASPAASASAPASASASQPSAVPPKGGLALPPNLARSAASPDSREKTAASRAGKPLAGGWVEYATPEGKVYYHNKEKGETRWSRPEEADAPAKVEEPEDDTDPDDANWKEVTAKDGKVYFYHKVTRKTSWVNPIEERKKKAAEAKKSQSKLNPSVSVTQTLELEEKAPRPQVTAVYGSKKERLEAFQGLLRDKEVPPTLKWEEALKKIINDERYLAFKTNGERKGAYTDWAEKRKKEIKEEEKLGKKRAREGFMKVLEEAGVRVRDNFDKVDSKLRDDERYKALKDRRDREDTFADYIADLRAKERENEGERRAKAKSDLRALLRGNTRITPSMRASHIEREVREEECYQELPKETTARIIDEFLTEMSQQAEEERKENAEAKKQKLKAAKKGFKDFLLEQLVAGKLTLKAKWEVWVETVRDEPAIKEMTSQGMRVSSEVFDHYLNDVDAEFCDHKRIIKKIMKAHEIGFSLTTTLEEYTSKLAETREKSFAEVTSDSIAILYHSLRQRTEKKLAKEDRGSAPPPPPEDMDTDGAQPKRKREEHREEEEEPSRKRSRHSDPPAYVSPRSDRPPPYGSDAEKEDRRPGKKSKKDRRDRSRDREDRKKHKKSRRDYDSREDYD